MVDCWRGLSFGGFQVNKNQHHLVREALVFSSGADHVSVSITLVSYGGDARQKLTRTTASEFTLFNRVSDNQSLVWRMSHRRLHPTGPVMSIDAERTSAAHIEYPLSHQSRLANRTLSKRMLCGVCSRVRG